MTARNADELIPTRQSLLSRLKNSEDRASWQDFFDTYWKLIHSVAIKSGLTEAEAQDAVQETVIAVAKNIKEFRYDPQKCSFKSWLMMITRQRIIWQLRKRLPAGAQSQRPRDATSRTSTIDKIPDEASLDLNAVWEEEWEKNLLAAALEQVKQQVNARQFQMFDLYVLQDWPAQEVARTLQVSVAQVYLAKYRISALLKKEAKKLERKFK